MTLLAIHTCARCHTGALTHYVDGYGEYLSCAQCGHQKYPERDLEERLRTKPEPGERSGRPRKGKGKYA